MTTEGMTTLAELREILGDSAFVSFLASHASTHVFFSKVTGGPQWDRLVKTVGVEKAEVLRKRFGGETVYIPKGAREERALRDAKIRARLARGQSYADVALTFTFTASLSERQVRRVDKKTDADYGQLSLLAQ